MFPKLYFLKSVVYQYLSSSRLAVVVEIEVVGVVAVVYLLGKEYRLVNKPESNVRHQLGQN